MLIGPFILSFDREEYEKGAFQDGSDWKSFQHLLLFTHKVFMNINNILSA